MHPSGVPKTPRMPIKVNDFVREGAGGNNNLLFKH